jgi:hypothetical protein
MRRSSGFLLTIISCIKNQITLSDVFYRQKCFGIADTAGFEIIPIGYKVTL